MFLIRLLIENDTGVVRDIRFHQGLNLIVDTSPSLESERTTGNNVGKTTVLRLIDFCLGGDSKEIYSDTEFKARGNSQIKDFLDSTHVIVSLELSNGLRIKRSFSNKGKEKLLEVNGENFSSVDKFRIKLQEEMFHSDVERPSFRQMIAKNLRIDNQRMENIVKVLHATTNIVEYEALYLFWLGVNTDSQKEKQRLHELIRSEKTHLARLSKTGNTLDLVKQKLHSIAAQIEELSKKKASFNLNEDYEKNLDLLNETREKQNFCSGKLAQLAMRKMLIQESKEELEQETAHIDTTQIGELYARAKLLMKEIQVSFEETVHFHNSLIAEKIKYVTEELPKLTSEMEATTKELESLRRLDKELSEKLRQNGVTQDMERLAVELNRLHEEKGQLENQKASFESLQDSIEKLNAAFDGINQTIRSKQDLIEERVALFNKYFEDLSNKLYGERYILTAPHENGHYSLSIDNWEGNPSTGKKKGQIAAFDFASILFADSLNLDALHFIVHDRMENVHDNQLRTLVQMANDLPLQYIVPILRDKMPGDIPIENFEILSLSQTDKLFRI
jgi:uncharacterized protein YydD (DUF2326 family)